MSDVRRALGRRAFLARFAALVLPVAAVAAATNTAQAKKQTVVGKSAWSHNSPKQTSQVRRAVHTAHAFGKSSR